MKWVHSRIIRVVDASGGNVDNVSGLTIEVVEIFASPVKSKGFAGGCRSSSHVQCGILIYLDAVSEADSCYKVKCCGPHNLADETLVQRGVVIRWVENSDLIVCGCENSSIVPIDEKH